MIGVKLFLCVGLLVTLTSAYPTVDVTDVEIEVDDTSAYPAIADTDVKFDDYELDQLDANNEESKIRSKRATCDLLSFVRVKHAPCAAHCIFKGFRGGWCNRRAVCNCRR